MYDDDCLGHYRKEPAMSIVVLRLPNVKGESAERPEKCPNCKGEIFQRWGEVSKPSEILNFGK